MAWRWTVPAIKSALEHAGVPPKLNMQAMLSAAFAVDGPELTANVFEIAVGTRVRELDADPILMPIPDGVTTVQINGQFLLMLLANRLDLLQPERKALPGEPDVVDPAQETLGLEQMAATLKP